MFAVQAPSIRVTYVSLGKSKVGLKARLFAAPLIRAGWRPIVGTPLDEPYCRGRFHYDHETEIKEDLSVVRNHSMVSFERMATLWQQVRYLDRHAIPGALVECGVWRGGSIGLMALAHMRSVGRPLRPLHLFDSFEGIPEPIAEVDGNAAVSLVQGRAGGSLRSTGILVSPLQDSKELLEARISYPAELIKYHMGWFQDTLPRDSDVLGDVALLRLDGDWHDSTVICLEYLYPKVVRHGVVVIDDYGHFEGCRKAVDAFLAQESTPILLNHIDYTGRFFVKPD